MPVASFEDILKAGFRVKTFSTLFGFAFLLQRLVGQAIPQLVHSMHPGRSGQAIAVSVVTQGWSVDKPASGTGLPEAL